MISLQRLAGFLALLTAAGTPTALAESVTPHDKYSSSIGVLGCKVNTNLIAYFPSVPDCDNLCYRISHQGRNIVVLHADRSGGAYDISYDVWNWLYTGRSARQDPVMGGGVEMALQKLSTDDPACKALFPGGKLAIIAINPDYATRCPQRKELFEFYNIGDAVCHWGRDEHCTVDGGYVTCGGKPPLAPGVERLPDSVFNVEYGTGKEVPAP